MVQALTGHSSQEEPFDIHSEGFKRVLKGIGIILVFCVLLKFLGFMLASAFMIPTIMRLMGDQSAGGPDGGRAGSRLSDFLCSTESAAAAGKSVRVRRDGNDGKLACCPDDRGAAL